MVLIHRFYGVGRRKLFYLKGANNLIGYTINHKHKASDRCLNRLEIASVTTYNSVIRSISLFVICSKIYKINENVEEEKTQEILLNNSIFNEIRKRKKNVW